MKFAVLILVSILFAGGCFCFNVQGQLPGTAGSVGGNQRQHYQQRPTTTGAASSPSVFPPVVCPPNNPAWNRMLAIQYYRQLASLNPTNFDKFLAPDLIQHNPNIPDGVQAMKIAVSPGGPVWNNWKGKPYEVSFEHVDSADNYVWMHLKLTAQSGQVFAVLNLYRFECELIKEHWDVIQAIDPNAPVFNSHPFF